jgi:ACS family D-galactonate transporter-like MFS transporter
VTKRKPNHWPLVALLVVSVAINYIDRGNLSVAAPLIKDEMGLSPFQLGILLSSFFWTYAVFNLVSGWLVDRLDVNWALAAGFLLWSATTAATGLAGEFRTLLILRMLLGVGESVAYPAYSKIFSARLDEGQRGVANALIDSGTKLGPALGTFAGGMLMDRFGWRPFFIVLGLGSLLWLPIWFKWMPRGIKAVQNSTLKAPSLAEILRHRAIWATFTGHFSGNYLWYFLLTWLPYYLVHERHLSMTEMAKIGTLPILFAAGATISAGWLSYRALAAGATPTKVRKTCTTVGLGGAAIVILVPVITNNFMSMVLLITASIFYGIFASSHWAITQTIAGPLAVGRWSGMQNFAGNLAGVAAPALTGFVVGRTGHFFWAFAAVAVVVLTGAMAYLFGLGPVEPANWGPKVR